MYRKITIFVLMTILISGCSSPVSLPTTAAAKPTETVPSFTVSTVQATMTPIVIPTTQNSAGECDNPFFPVSDGATWEYSISTGTSATHTLSVDDNDAFTITVQGKNSTFTIDGQCAEEGIVLMDAPGASTTYSGEEGSSAVKTTNESGVTLPKDIGIGAEWSQTIDTATGDIKATIVTNYTAVGFENITVPAGNFYVLKVEQSGYIKMMGQTIKMHGFNWFVEGVGTVKSAMDDAPIVELVSYDIPD
jgi:hypothetical protein